MHSDKFGAMHTAIILLLPMAPFLSGSKRPRCNQLSKIRSFYNRFRLD